MLKRLGASLRSRWGALALGGLTAGTLFTAGMWRQAAFEPSLAPVLVSDPASEVATVWVLFQRMDCVEKRWVIEGWNRVAEEGELQVVGWALDSSNGWPPGRDPVDALELSFEVRSGPVPPLARALPALGIERTPAILVVDREGRLRRVVPGDVLNTPSDLEAIIQDVESLDL